MDNYLDRHRLQCSRAINIPYGFPGRIYAWFYSSIMVVVSWVRWATIQIRIYCRRRVVFVVKLVK